MVFLHNSHHLHFLRGRLLLLHLDLPERNPAFLFMSNNGGVAINEMFCFSG